MTTLQLHLNIEKIIIVKDIAIFIKENLNVNTITLASKTYKVDNLIEICENILYSEPSEINNREVRDLANLINEIKNFHQELKANTAQKKAQAELLAVRTES